MTRHNVRIWVLATLILWQAPLLASQDISEGVPPEILEEAEKSYIFVFTDDVEADKLRRLAQGFASKEGGSVRHVFTKALKGFSANVSQEGAARIAGSPQIAYYEPNRIRWALDRRPQRTRDQGGPDSKAQGNGPGGPDDGGDEQPPQVVPWGIERVGGPQDGTGLHAWIIDTGIDQDHPDLNVGYGANFVTQGSTSESADDDNGHGTHVAGTVGAIDNDIGVVGVAANATVHPVKVLSKSGWGLTDWIVAGIDYVAANGAPSDIANMSLGGPGHSDIEHDAVVNTADLGIRFSISAGNDSDDAEDYEPAHVEHQNVFTISAIDDQDVFASFSNWGDPVDYTAPGVDILSTEADGTVTLKNGTSMAAPHVGGLLLLMHPNNPVTDGYAIDDPDGNPDPIAHFYVY